jgi:N-acetylneuraminic acid mutarotase
MARVGNKKSRAGAAALAPLALAAPLLGAVVAAAPASAQAAGGFVATGSLVTPVSHATATLLSNGEVLVAGGQDSAGGALGSAELYNPSSGAWTPTASMPVPVTDATATLLANGEVLVAGGLTESASALVPTTASQLYDPVTGQWSLTPGQLQQATFDASAALLGSGDVLYVGGLPSTSPAANAVTTAESYDPFTGVWSLASSLPTGVAGAEAASLSNGEVLLAGGETGASGTVTNAAEVYSATSNAWSPVAAMPVGVAYAATTKLSSGEVLVAGGETTPEGALTAATQVFNPSSGSWQTASGLPASSFGATATLLGSGEVLYAGGLTSTTGSGGPIAAAEVYNPSNGTWTMTGSLLVAEGFGTATLLGNGDVLIAGGQAAAGPTAEAELYVPTLAPGAPAITSPSIFDVVAGSFNTFTVTTTGTPAPTITESGALPPGMNFTYNGNGTATISGTPPASAVGSYVVTLSASNGVGAPAVQQFDVTVESAPVVVSAPRFTSSASVLVLPGANAVVTITASGTPRPVITESGTLPPGMSFAYEGNGRATISGVTPGGLSGTFAVRLTASNGTGSSASQILRMTVGRPAVPEASFGAGYWYTTAGGEVIGQGSALPVAPVTEQHPSRIVSMAPTADHLGYYLASSAGGVFPYGDARWYGSIAGRHLSSPTVAIAVTPSGGGYYLVTRAGNVFNFGDARWYGSTAGRHVPPIAAFALTPNGLGYWLVSVYGNIYAFGDARFYGSPANHLIPRVVAFAPTPDGSGYWLVTEKGNVFNYGNARWYGSLAQRSVPAVVAFGPAPGGQGYWLVTGKGNVFNFGNARWYGSSAGVALPTPVTSFAVEP